MMNIIRIVVQAEEANPAYTKALQTKLAYIPKQGDLSCMFDLKIKELKKAFFELIGEELR